MGVWSLPTVSIAGSNSVCLGSVISLTASGASTYSWSSGATGPVTNETPTLTTTYIVTGTDLNACTNTNVINVQVLPVPSLTALSDKTVICNGGSIALTVIGGALSYTWSNGAQTPNTSASPTVSTVFSVTGTDANTCKKTETIGIVVNPLPNILITTTRPNLCIGEKAVLTATGANVYSWTGGQTTFSILVSPTLTTLYSLTGIDANNCVNTATFSQVVSGCVGIQEAAKAVEKIAVYPNPNNGNFVVRSVTDVELILWNDLGQAVKLITLDAGNDHHCSLSGLSSGIYFISSKGAAPQNGFKLVVTP